MSIQLKITTAAFLVALAGSSVRLAAQVDIANVELNFDSPVATSNANVTKYNDVFTANGTEYDALVTLESLTGGSITSADNTSTSQGNQARYFSPRFSWNSGGGSAVYLVQFIEDDTEDDPQLVTFLNFSVNSYDLDGGVSGSGAAGQFSSFSNFDSYTLGNSTDLNVTSSGELTKFQCGVNVSSSTADIENWVKTSYTSVSTFEFAVGASGSGAAYYFIDFSEGTFAGNSNVTETENSVNVTFTSFDPTSACAGDTLFLSGENFFAVDAVEVGGESASDYLLAASDSMWVVVPAITGTPTDEVTVYNNSTPTAVSGFSFAVDSDSDGVCDNEDNCTDLSACNYDSSVTNAACTYATTWYADDDADGLGDSSDSQSACAQPTGYVADSSDNCDDLTATNYDDSGNASCTYGIAYTGLDSLLGCENQANVTMDLDTMHTGTGIWTYSIDTNIDGFASSSVSSNLIEIDFSANGLGRDTVEVSGTDGTNTVSISLIVQESTYPYWTSIDSDGASLGDADGGAVYTFEGHGNQAVTVHYFKDAVMIFDGGINKFAGYGPEYTLESDADGNWSDQLTDAVWVSGYTNAAGCYSPEPATSGMPTSSPKIRQVTVPHLVD